MSEWDYKKDVDLSLFYAGKQREIWGFTRQSYGGLYGWAEAFTDRFILTISPHTSDGRSGGGNGGPSIIMLCIDRVWEGMGEIDEGKYSKVLVEISIFDPEGISKVEKELEKLKDADYFEDVVNSLKAHW